MLNVFQIAPQDQSLYYLGQLFGNVGVALQGTGPVLLGNMFRVFNTALLVVGTLIVVYVTVMGVLKTAHEGEFMGKQWSSLWLPLRMVGGIVALMPTATGYCAIQVIIMWFIIQGIGAADMVWKSAVDYLYQGGAVTTPEVPADLNNTAQGVIAQLFADLSCQAVAQKVHANDANTFARSTPVTDGYKFGRPQTSADTVDPSAECGTVSWADTTDPAMKSAQQAAIQTLVPVLENIANFYVNAAIADSACWGTACTEVQKQAQPPVCLFNLYQGENVSNDACSIKNTTAHISDLINGISGYTGSNFMTDAVNLLAGYAYNYSMMGINPAAKYNDVYQAMYANGWMYAGSYFYSIAKTNQQPKENYMSFISSINVNGKTNGGGDISSHFAAGSGFYAAGSSYPDFKTYSMIQTFYATALNAGKSMSSTGRVGQADFSASSSGGGGPIGAQMSKTAQNMIHHWAMNLGPEDKNPIVAMQSFGEDLLNGAEALFWTILAITIGVVAAGGATATFVLGAGTMTGISIAWGVLVFLLPAVLFLIGIMVTLGGLLGVYLPLLPYILFTFGVVGWFIMVIEAMVAAPLLAIGLLSPHGQSEVLGRAEHAPMMVLNIFLRPTLMVFGMMAGLLLSFILAKLLNAAFYNVVASVIQGHDIGLFEGGVYIFTYAGILIAMVNKSFALIHIIPDKVLGWIGHRAEGAGEEGMAQAAKGTSTAGAEGMASAGKGLAGAPKGAADAGKGVKEKLDADQKAGKIKGK